MQMGKTLPTSVLDMTEKQTDSETLVIPKVWGIQSTPSLPLIPSPLLFKVVAPDRVLSMTQIEQFDM